MLTLLKQANADLMTLYSVFITIIRPVLEYACQVWHVNIPSFRSRFPCLPPPPPPSAHGYNVEL